MQLAKKNKNPEYSLLSCISRGSDYTGLYPTKKHQGVSPELFLSYQTRVRGVPKRNLTLHAEIAGYLKANFPDAAKFEDFRKDLKNDFAKQSKTKKAISEMVNTGDLKFTDYLALFAQNGSTKINSDAWKFISYYTYHTDLGLEDAQIEDYSTSNDLSVYVGTNIFEIQLANLGEVRFKKEVSREVRFRKNKHCMVATAIFKKRPNPRRLYLPNLESSMPKLTGKRNNL